MISPNTSSWDSVPIVPGANLFGHGHLLTNDRFGFLRRAGEAGPVSRMRVANRWFLLANSPEVAHEVLVEQARSFEKSPGIRILLRDFAGEGLFTSEGELWRRQRRLLSPLFHASRLSDYASAMREVAQRAAERLVPGQSIDIAHEMMRITMGIVAATLFGTDVDSDANELGEALTVALGWINDHLTSNALVLQVALLEAFEHARPHTPAPIESLVKRIEHELSTPFLIPGRRSPKLSAALNLIDTRIQALVDERRAAPEARADLLARLLLARDSEGGSAAGMNDTQVRDETVTLFVAGHETTANALAWSFYLLARSPEARARVQSESDAYAANGGSGNLSEVLPYTTRVFKEALRLYPPIVMFPRRSLEPVSIQGRSYPEHTIVFVSPFAIHMSPSVWPSPDRFDPDRFTPENEATRHRSAWLPFGVGPRVCIGNAFALMEGPIVLATLMARHGFEIDSTKVIEPDVFATVRPRGGVPAIVRPRQS